MKRAERQPWLDISGYELCSWCRYGDRLENGGVACEHPLTAVGEDKEPDSDCWGFRPWPGDTPGLARGRVMDRLEGRDGR